MRRPHSLRSRIALSVALLVCALSWLLGTLIGQRSGERMGEEFGQGLAELSFQMVDRLDRDMDNRARLLQVISELQALRQPDDIRQVRALLDSLQHELPDIAWIGFTDPDGLVLASSNGVLEGVNIAQRPVYQRGIQGRFIGDVHEAVLLARLLPNPTGEAMKFVDIALPVKGPDGRTVGVLASHLSWSWADEVRRALIEPMQTHRRVEFFILSSDRSVLLGPASSIGQKLELPALASIDARKSFWSVQRWPDGRRYLTGFAPSHGYRDYPGLGWIVVTRQAEEEAFAPAHALQREIYLWGGALAIFFAVLGWALAARVTRPLQRIADAADRLSAGEIAVIPSDTGTREIRTLSKSIAHLVESLTQQQLTLGLLENKAHHDPLTGLPNRAALEKHLPRLQQRCHVAGGALGLLYLDLDGFKPINDTHGHAVGDLVLREAAQRMRGCLRDGDLVARLGGDEFLMVLQLQQDDGLSHISRVAQRALQVLGEPMLLEGRTLGIGCSIGGALWPRDGERLEEVMERADQALYRAKREGRNRAFLHDEDEAVHIAAGPAVN